MTCWSSREDPPPVSESKKIKKEKEKSRKRGRDALVRWPLLFPHRNVRLSKDASCSRPASLTMSNGQCINLCEPRMRRLAMHGGGLTGSASRLQTRFNARGIFIVLKVGAIMQLKCSTAVVTRSYAPTDESAWTGNLCADLSLKKKKAPRPLQSLRMMNRY